jgi:hypothetical protein
MGGCRTAHNVAVTSFRVLDAPRQFVRRQFADETDPAVTNTTTVQSDSVTRPGTTVTPSDPNARRRTTTTSQSAPRTTVKPGPSPRSSPPTVTEKPKPSPGPSRSSTSQAQLPTAKPVPGKPGYVFSPFDPSGGYVDVTGYASGQKVKDPYSGKIFLVP